MHLVLLISLGTILGGAPGTGTLACAHRGDQACAPENTLAAFRSAVEKSAPMIEFDVQATHDGRLVIMHDPTVDRTTNGKGKVSELSFAEIRALDAGSWFKPRFKGEQVPTLEEALEVIAQKALDRKTGARGLRSIMEGVMRNVMYEIPSRPEVKKCVVDAETILRRQEPLLLTQTDRVLSDDELKETA